MRLTVVESADAAARVAAERLVAALAGGGQVSLAGGRTPRRAYELLADRPGVDWSGVDLWFGDERCVPAADPDSNYRLVAESLLARGTARAARVHRIRGEDDPDAAAAAYSDEIAGVVLDVALLGLGEDGHTASLFPGSPALEVRDRAAVAVTATKPPPRRITLTYPVFDAARSIVVLAPGAAKAAAIAAVLRGPDPAVPASLLPTDRTEIVTDRDGAARAVPARPV
jgi:6-phosphogluconolactonase